MGVGTALLIVSAATAVAGAVQQHQAAEAASDAAQRTEDLRVAEAQRQIGVANIQAQEQASDRVRQGDREFASAMVGLAETGAAGGINAVRFATQIGFEEGIDLARIESNRSNEVAALASGQVAANQRAANARSLASTRKTGAAFGLVGSGLQIAGAEQGRSQERERERDRT